ncbi:MAG: hypothetical protein M1835_002393 [Candelina submexicana]|nr:MAG: hypothetical protein M1835_002393 [Candelina submexicana]
MSLPTLPTIDIFPFLPSSTCTPFQKQKCAASIFAACHDTGFFYLTNHSIPSTQTAEILSLARTFFTTAPLFEKLSIARRNCGVGDGDGARGWQRIGENLTGGKRDWHEAVDLYRDVGAREGKGPFDCLMGPNKWPTTPEGLKEKYEEYVEKMLELGEAVVMGMGWALLGEEGQDVFVKETRESFWVMRLIGYPPLPADVGDNDGRVSCGEHSDYGCVTLLLADDTKGALQVQAKDGSWIEADPVPGAFVVNIGDMMERWTNGLWKSTRHRVVHKGGGYRVSVPFFFEPDFEALVEPLESCVRRTGGERKYKEVRYGDHLKGKVMGNFFDDEDGAGRQEN